MVAIYHHTKTLENIKQNPTAILQLLTTRHVDIVKVCGKQSGHSTDKIKAVAKKHPLMTVASLACLEDCAGYMVVEFVDLLEVGGDHVLAVAKVLESKNLSDEALLTTGWLKAQKIIR
jgi:flavin reductase (DIM6/NTAB) family NADH-FMN oxidoreductase RutF